MHGVFVALWAFSSCGEWELLLWQSTGNRMQASVIVQQRPRCTTAYGILPDEGLNLCLLHRQADSFVFVFLIYKFLFFFLGVLSPLLCWLFSSCGEQGLLSRCTAQISHCRGFSYCGAQAIGHVGFSSWGSWTLQHKLNKDGAQDQLLCELWDLPRSGIESMSPALWGGFFTTEPPGKTWQGNS